MGLTGVGLIEWYRNIILEDLYFSSDSLLEICTQKLKKEDKNLPTNKYLSMATRPHTTLIKEAVETNFENLISKTIRDNRNTRVKTQRNVMAIWNDDNSSNTNKKLDLIAHLKESEINIEDLEKILIEIFEKNKDVLTTNSSTYVRKLIRIYDYIKYGKKVRETDSANNEVIHASSPP